MSLSEILYLISGIGLGGLLLAAVGFYFISNPDKLLSLWSRGAQLLFRFRRKKQRMVVSERLSSYLNSAIFRLRKEAPSAFPQSMKIKWITSDAEFSRLEEGEVILYVRDNPDEDQILVNTTMLYLKQGVISTSRPYVDRRLLSTIDMTLAQRILTDFPKAYGYLQEKYVDPALSSQEMAELYRLSENLEEFGVLTRVVLLEYSGLANKLKGKQSTARVRQETFNFAHFVEGVVNRETPDVPLRFYGRLFSTTIALVADPAIARAGGISLYQKKFQRDIVNGTKIIHLLARGTNNVQLARYIGRWAIDNKLISRLLPSFYYDPTAEGGRIPAGCISCFSSRVTETVELSPVDEVYSVLAEIVPEILLGKVEIVAVEREEGIRTKIVVRSSSIDNPIGLFIGTNGSNVEKLKALLSTQEEIDFIKWSVVPEDIISQALYPLRDDEITSIKVDNDRASAQVLVTAKNLIGVAIGKKGVNIRLASQVTGYQIDVQFQDDAKSPEDEVSELIKKNITSVAKGEIELIRVRRISGELTKVLIKSNLVDSLRSEISVVDRTNLSNLLGEPIHFVEWSNDLNQLIINSLPPLHRGEVRNIYPDPNNKNNIIVEVITDQTLREAVGRGGINVKVAQKLVDKTISIRVVN